MSINMVTSYYFQIHLEIKMLKYLMLLVALVLLVLLASETVEAWGAPHWGLTDYGWWYRGAGRGAFIPRGYAILNR